MGSFTGDANLSSALKLPVFCKFQWDSLHDKSGVKSKQNNVYPDL